MTTIYRNGRFWVIDAATSRTVETFPSYPDFGTAREAIGDAWQDSTLAQDEGRDL